MIDCLSMSIDGSGTCLRDKYSRQVSDRHGLYSDILADAALIDIEHIDWMVDLLSCWFS